MGRYESFSENQFVCFSACKNADADIVFVIDSSETSSENWNMLKSFLRGIVQNMPVGRDGVSFGAVVFSNEGRVVSELYKLNDQRSAMDAVSNLPHMGGKIVTCLGGINYSFFSIPCRFLETRQKHIRLAVPTLVCANSLIYQWQFHYIALCLMV